MEETLKEKVTYPRLCKESSWLGIKSLPLGSCALTSGILPWTDWCSLLKHCWCSSFRCFCSVICKNSKLHSFNKYCIKQQIIQEKIAPSCSPNVVFLEFFFVLFCFLSKSLTCIPFIFTCLWASVIPWLQPHDSITIVRKPAGFPTKVLQTI